MKNILFVGAKPNLAKNHPGGQSTAAYGLMHYCSKNNIHLDIIDSAQESFPYPSIGKRLFRAFKRLMLCLVRLCTNKYNGAIIFSGAGSSFLEKIILAAVCRVFSTKCIFFVRSGFFISECEVAWKRKLYTKLLKIPNFIGSQGQSWNQLFKNLGVHESKIKLIPNWLSPSKQPSKHSKIYDEKSNIRLKLIFVGWIVKTKGVQDIIDAIEGSSILKSHQFIFAGDGELKEELEVKCKKACIENIDFLGWQTSHEIEVLMKSSDIFVFPSHSEGFPNVIVEALAAALPIVTTGVGGIKDSAIDQHNALIIDVSDTHALRNSLEELVQNKELRNKFSKNSLEIYKERHDLETNCSKLMEILI